MSEMATGFLGFDVLEHDLKLPSETARKTKQRDARVFNVQAQIKKLRASARLLE